MSTWFSAKADKHCLCRAHYKRIRANASLPALSETFAGLALPSILGGNVAKANADGFSYWAAEPKDVFEFEASQREPFGRLHAALAKYVPAPGPVPPFTGPNDLTDGGPPFQRAGKRGLMPPKGMFSGGWIGYFGYELGRHIERLPQTTIDDLRMPVVRLCFYDRVIAYDHHADVFWVVALELPGDEEKPAEKITAMESLLRQSLEIKVTPPPRTDIEHLDASRIQCNMDKDFYLQAVKKIRHLIHEGDVYQVNFSQRFESPFTGRPVRLFHWQNCYNPCGYGAYLDAGDFQIVSASPEMFITINDSMIYTRPIKGTRRRVDARGSDGERLNTTRFNELLTSEKEQAELNMIVDLERNDVARICKPGTRRVVQPRMIESYPTVFHAAATIGGELRPDVTLSDVLKAMFPGGSITGAPKIRAMEVIDELEPTERGVYTGCIGFIGLDGTVCLNIAIRTIIITGHNAFAQAGGGIVVDSDPEAEWDETQVKARALLAGIAAVRSV